MGALQIAAAEALAATANVFTSLEVAPTVLEGATEPYRPLAHGLLMQLLEHHFLAS